MSRVGKQPVELPQGVSAKVSGQLVEIKGPKGTLSRTIHERVEVSHRESTISVKPLGEDKPTRALWGLSRSLINNMVQGVSRGFSKVLEINGVGYRAELKGKELHLALGYSHPVVYALPEGIKASVERNLVTISGIDKELVGQTAAIIRAFRPPEPYKGKGIKYRDEEIRRKVGKAGVK